MTALLFGLLLTMILPLLIGAWPVSLAGLALQGLLITLIAIRADHPSPAMLCDLVLLRTIIVPAMMARILLRHGSSSENHVIPRDLVSWTIAALLVMVSFRLAAALAPHGAASATHLAVATAGLLLGLFVLSTQESPVSQLLGVLRVENATVLFELLDQHHGSLALELGVSGIYLLTVFVLAHVLDRLLSTPPGPDSQTETVL